jgi:serine/threonine-protein kinase
MTDPTTDQGLPAVRRFPLPIAPAAKQAESATNRVDDVHLAPKTPPVKGLTLGYSPEMPPATGSEWDELLDPLARPSVPQINRMPTPTAVLAIEPCRAGDELGPYRLERLLGEGGMGSVFHARHQILGREVAIKVLLPELSLQPEVVRRFFQEAQAVNCVHHPNVVNVTDCVFTKDRPPYMIMEYLAGQSLGRYLQDHAPLPPDEVIDLGLQITSAMEAVHARGIVHRDLKPDNIFLVPDPRGGLLVKLLDFGVAKFLSQDEALVHTRTGALIGTPEYMAPEQIQGGQVDHRADVYALGAIFFEMLTGRPPFAATQIGQLLLKQIGEQPVPPSLRRPASSHAAIPGTLDQAVLRCLAKAPADRVQSMGQLRELLEWSRDECSGPVAAGESTQVVVLADLDELRPRRRWPLPLAVGLGAALLLGTGAWWLAGGDRGDHAPARRDAAPAARSAAPRPAPTVLPRVTVTSLPAGADVFDVATGQHLGQTPLGVEVPAGSSRAVELRRAGHDPLRAELRAERPAPPAMALAPRRPATPAPVAAPVTAPPARPVVAPDARPRPAPAADTRPRPARSGAGMGSESGTVDPFD